MKTFEAFLWSLVLALTVVAVPIYGKTPMKYESPHFAPSLSERHEAHKVLCEKQRDCKTLAEAVYFESRGEQINGQIAVAYTIINRARHEAWPDTVKGVVYQGCQFSYTCDGSKERGIQNTEAWGRAKLVAWGVLNGLYFDPTKGANHYLEPTKVKHMPRWTKVYQKVASIGNHIFYRR